MVQRGGSLLLGLTEDFASVKNCRIGVHVHGEDILTFDISVARRQIDRTTIEVAHAITLPTADHEADRVAIWLQWRRNDLSQP